MNSEVKRFDLAPDHIAQVFFDDGGWQWAYLREVGYKWVRVVRLAWNTKSERMLRSVFDGRVLEDTVRPATDEDRARWQRITSSWREDEGESGEEVAPA